MNTRTWIVLAACLCAPLAGGQEGLDDGGIVPASIPMIPLDEPLASAADATISEAQPQTIADTAPAAPDTPRNPLQSNSNITYSPEVYEQYLTAAAPERSLMAKMALPLTLLLGGVVFAGAVIAIHHSRKLPPPPAPVAPVILNPRVVPAYAILGDTEPHLRPAPPVLPEPPRIVTPSIASVQSHGRVSLLAGQRAVGGLEEVRRRAHAALDYLDADTLRRFASVLDDEVRHQIESGAPDRSRSA